MLSLCLPLDYPFNASNASLTIIPTPIHYRRLSFELALVNGIKPAHGSLSPVAGSAQHAILEILHRRQIQAGMLSLGCQTELALPNLWDTIGAVWKESVSSAGPDFADC
jgi:hypothetical protein